MLNYTCFPDENTERGWKLRPRANQATWLRVSVLDRGALLGGLPVCDLRGNPLMQPPKVLGLGSFLQHPFFLHEFDSTCS